MVQQYRVSDSYLLKIEVGCNVNIYSSNTNTVTIGIEASEKQLKDFSVSQSGKTLSIKQKFSSNAGSSVVIGNGNVVIGNMSFGNVSQVISNRSGTYINTGYGNEVYVNGVKVDTSGTGVSETIPTINIYTPSCDFEAVLGGVSVLNSNVQFESAYIDAKGSLEAKLSSVDLDLNGSGSIRGKFEVIGGELNISASGSIRAGVVGEFSKVSVSVSGSGQIVTSGLCKGDYKAVVSGSGSITHRGDVKGRVRESVSGSGSIEI